MHEKILHIQLSIVAFAPFLELFYREQEVDKNYPQAKTIPYPGELWRYVFKI
jgi:hypothetical protein